MRPGGLPVDLARTLCWRVSWHAELGSLTEAVGKLSVAVSRSVLVADRRSRAAVSQLGHDLRLRRAEPRHRRSGIPRSNRLRRATLYAAWARAQATIGDDYFTVHDLRHLTDRGDWPLRQPFSTGQGGPHLLHRLIHWHMLPEPDYLPTL